MTEIAKQLRWIRNIYEELGFKLGPLPLCIDNQGAMFLASNPAQEGRTKHIRIPEHYIREAVELGEIKLYYVPTDLQFADIFTKNLGKQKFQEGRKALRLSRFHTS
jgi:hypothetical protein